MSDRANESELVVLTADKNMKFAIQGLLNRPESLGIRPVIVDFFIHPERDPGCLLRADAVLRSFSKRFSHAIVMFDREGCGKEQKKTREELEKEVTLGLSRSGWGNRAAAIVIDPELEIWVFSDSPDVDEAIGWKGRKPSVRPWLEEKNYLVAGEIKPSRPKEAMEAALRHVRRPRSSSIYAQVAKHVNFGMCIDPAFLKLKKKLQSWFPVPRYEKSRVLNQQSRRKK